MNHPTIKIKLIKSKYGRLPVHLECLKGLGLRKLNQSVELKNTPEVRGMVNKISYMLHFEEF
ncbi:MAG: 50S ribosomal protein L30 [Methylovulum sp.]|nr:50S ribosomal protein L30 [Methylovulum sp.]TSA40573.1 MAG: 50S ribosomal protein L30 [Methylococcaceae bacterium]